MEFILASSSPRRKQLLSTIISNFDIIPSDIDENKLKKLEPNPQKLAEKLSYEKAYSIFTDKYKENNEYTVIGSDTLVSFGNIILGKPKDRDDAIRILKLLQGNSHDIYTGTTVIIKKEHSIIFETRDLINQPFILKICLITIFALMLIQKNLWIKLEHMLYKV